MYELRRRIENLTVVVRRDQHRPYRAGRLWNVARPAARSGESMQYICMHLPARPDASSSTSLQIYHRPLVFRARNGRGHHSSQPQRALRRTQSQPGGTLSYLQQAQRARADLPTRLRQARRAHRVDCDGVGARRRGSGQVPSSRGSSRSVLRRCGVGGDPSAAEAVPTRRNAVDGLSGWILG